MEVLAQRKLKVNYGIITVDIEVMHLVATFIKIGYVERLPKEDVTNVALICHQMYCGVHLSFKIRPILNATLHLMQHWT